MRMNKYKLIIFLVGLFLLPFTGYSQQLGTWTTLNNLNIGRFANIAVLAYDTIIYTLGGFTYSTTPYPVEKTTIKPDGTLTEWSIDSQTMKSARCAPVGYFYNGYLYAIGGDSGPGVSVTSTVERAKVNSDGSLSQWVYISPFPYGFLDASLILSPPYVYVIGGWNSTTEYSNEILRGKIQSDGDIKEWTVSTSSLLEGMNCPSTILIDSTIYVVSGHYTRNIESAPVYPDGELGSFKFVGVTMATHCYPALLYDGKYLNIIGGQLGGNFEYRGERVLVKSDGMLGNPELAPALQIETGGFGWVQASTGGYVMGGSPDKSIIQFAPFLPPTSIDKKYWEVME